MSDSMDIMKIFILKGTLNIKARFMKRSSSFSIYRKLSGLLDQVRHILSTKIWEKTYGTKMFMYTETFEKMSVWRNLVVDMRNMGKG